MKKRTFMAGLALISAISCASEDKNFFANLPVKETPHVTLNISPDFRTITHASEAQGIEDIQKEILKDRDEEGWAYLPEKQVWVELAKSSFNGRYDDGNPFRAAEFDEVLTTQVMRDNAHVIIYHNHPLLASEYKEYIDASLVPFRLDNSDTTFNNGLRRAMNYQLQMPLAMPSLGDIAFMILQTLEFNNLHSEGQFEEKIVSYHGVTTFALTDKGVNTFRDASSDALSAYVSAKPSFGTDYYRLANAILETPKAAGDTLEAMMSDRFMTVTFDAFRPDEQMGEYKAKFGPNQ
ncbi:MAG: hypothetical protein ABIA93_04125 [Candidatus Woesearchaeota archaeon]